MRCQGQCDRASAFRRALERCTVVRSEHAKEAFELRKVVRRLENKLAARELVIASLIRERSSGAAYGHA